MRGCWGSDFSHFTVEFNSISDRRAHTWAPMKLTRYNCSANTALSELATTRGEALIDPQVME